MELRKIGNLRNFPEDWCVLNKPSSGPDVGSFFGVSSRGEAVKPSTIMPSKGVILERPWVARLFLELARKRKPNV